MAKLSFAIAFLAYFFLTEAVDFDVSVYHVGREIATGIGLDANFVFTNGSDYPPISEDVSFWCIEP